MGLGIHVQLCRLTGMKWDMLGCLLLLLMLLPLPGLTQMLTSSSVLRMLVKTWQSMPGLATVCLTIWHYQLVS